MASPRPSRIRTVMPWVVAFGLLAWLFNIVPLADLEQALRRAPLHLFVLLVVGFVGATLLADSWATWVTFRYTLPDVPIRFRETLNIRGATYLLALLHYGVGQGGMAYFLHKRHGVELARSSGAVLLTMGVNFSLIALCATVGVLSGGAPADPGLRAAVLALACGLPVYLAVVAARPRFLARRKWLEPLFQAGLGGNLRILAARLPHIAVLIAGHYLAMRIFGVHPPFGQALALLPVVFIVAVLPISPSGLGTGQAAAVALFKDQPAASVLAYSLSLQFLGLILQALVGVVFLRAATRAGNVSDGGSAPP